MQRNGRDSAQTNTRGAKRLIHRENSYFQAWRAQHSLSTKPEDKAVDKGIFPKWINCFEHWLFCVQRGAPAHRDFSAHASRCASRTST